MKYFVFFLFPILVLATACKRDRTVWETNWQVPLLKDTLTLNKLITESLISVNGDYLELSFDRTIYELNLSDVIKIPDTTIRHTYAISIQNFNVPPGASFVNDAEEHDIGLGDIQLKKVRIKSGGIFLKLLNPIETITNFGIELPGVTKNGVLLSQYFVAPAGTNANPGVVAGFVDLAGYEMDLRGENFGSFNKIQSLMKATTDPNGPTVNVTNMDSLKFLVTMQDVKIDYARGYFGNQIISDTITKYIQALEMISTGMIDLPASTLDLEIVNGLKVAAKAMIKEVKNTNSEGSAVIMEHPQIGSWIPINSATGNEYALQPSVTNLVCDGANSNIESMLENHGASNTIGFQLQLNPWGNISGGWDEIFPQSKLKVNLSANMPLDIGLSDVVLQDTFAFSFKQDFTKTHVKSGSIWMDANNAFPFSAEVILYLMNANGITIAAIPATADILSSVYGIVTNNVLQKKSSVEFIIPESAMNQLETVTQLCVKVKLNTPDAGTNVSGPIPVPAGAFFGFKIGAKLKVEARI